MRLEGWEGRLAAVLAAAQGHAYELGTHDCFRVACHAVEALTGIDRWPEFAGKYSTRREALRLIARYGASFETAFDWFFGAAHVNPRFGRRGDIAGYLDSTGEKHLGVVLGEETAVLGAAGLLHAPTLDCLCAWRIG